MPMTARTDIASTELERKCQRLAHLYEIGKLFASFDTVEQTFDPALGIAARTLPLRSAILIQTQEGRSQMIVWCSEDQSPEQLRAVKEHLEKSFGSLVGVTSTVRASPHCHGRRDPWRTWPTGSSSSRSSWLIAPPLAPFNWRGPSPSTNRT